MRIFRKILQKTTNVLQKTLKCCRLVGCCVACSFPANELAVGLVADAADSLPALLEVFPSPTVGLDPVEVNSFAFFADLAEPELGVLALVLEDACLCLFVFISFCLAVRSKHDKTVE